jgi:peptidoglycan/LPS O-acetylase OafA/YrhL
MDSPNISRHIPELDGLRGFAIILVVLYHAVYLPQLPMPALVGNVVMRIAELGWSGVDLFFVLSGFLIGGILIDNRESEHYFSTFYARRAYRILPLYFAIIAVYGAIWAFGGSARMLVEGFFGPPMPWYSYATFTQNLWIGKHEVWNVFNNPTWSLAVEEQFYLTLPFIVRFVPRKHLFKIVALIGIVAASLRPVLMSFGVANGTQSYVWTLFRADALMIGVLCALVLHNERLREFLDRRIWVLYTALMLLVILLTVMPRSIAYPPAMWLFHGGFTSFSLLYGCLLLITVLRSNRAVTGVLRLRPLIDLGTISYCIYLLHDVLLHAVLAVARTYEQAWAGTLLAILLTVLLSSLSWHVFEKQFIRLAHKYFPYQVAELTCPESTVMTLPG